MNTIQERSLAVVVEDEPLVRIIAADSLADAGFEVIEACDAREALVALQAHAPRIGLLFADVHMPGTMDGLDLARHVHAHWPWIGVLIASGAERLLSVDMPSGARFIAKPYDMADLLTHAQELTQAVADRCLP